MFNLLGKFSRQVLQRWEVIQTETGSFTRAILNLDATMLTNPSEPMFQRKVLKLWETMELVLSKYLNHTEASFWPTISHLHAVRGGFTY